MACLHCGADLPPASGRCTVCGHPAAPGVAIDLLTPPGQIGPISELERSLADAETIPPPSREVNHGPLKVGDAFGPRYHILRMLGAGGMGTVYHAWDNELGIAVALKVIRPEVLHTQGGDDVERRFKRELLLARQVTHKNVVRIHDLGELNGIRYITMPFIDGADLATVLKNNGTVPVERAMALSRQIVAGLVAAHEVGVVHRDLKPANIMVDGDDRALIMDFGIARSTSGTTGATMTHGVVGTLEYMAPEQARGEPADQRADIYAFGLILYDMLVGHHHIGVGESAVTGLMKRMQAVPQSPRTIDPAVPEELDALITTCLQPDPAARFQTTEALAAALARLDAHGRAADGVVNTLASPSVTLPLPASESKRPQWLLGVGAIAAVAMIVAAVWWTRIGPSQTSQSTAATSTTGGTTSAGKQKFMAVLPFTVNDDAIAHVATGIGEGLSAKLFQLKDVRLAQGAAVEGAAKLGSPDKIGRELGVNLIVTGGVQTVGDRLQIDVNVDDVQGNRRVWTKQYTGLPEDLLTLEDQIYHELLAVVGITAANEELARAAVHPTENFEAYQLYLKGRNVMRGQQDPKNVQAAIKLYEQARDKDTGFALAYSGIADAALQMYRYTRDSTWTARAISAAQQAASLDDKLVEVHLALGNAYRFTGRAAEGITELRIATQLAPNSDDAFRQLGRAYLQAGRQTEAIEALQKAVDINPYFWVNHNTLGAAFLQMGDYDRAIAANLKVIELEPDNVNGYNDLGGAYLWTGRFEEAAGAFEKALKLLPNPETYTNLGVSYYYVGKFNEAVPQYEKAVELSPNDELVVGNLGDGYRMTGQVQKANATYDRAIALGLKQLRTNPKNALVRANIGLYYAKKGDAVLAAQFLKDARAIDRTNVYLMYNQAIAYALTNRSSEAFDSLREAFVAGYQVPLASHDPDLKALRSDPRFQELLAQFSKKPR